MFHLEKIHNSFIVVGSLWIFMLLKCVKKYVNIIRKIYWKSYYLNMVIKNTYMYSFLYSLAGFKNGSW